MKNSRIDIMINISTTKDKVEIITNLLIETLEPMGLRLIEQNKPYTPYNTDKSHIELIFTDGHN